MNLFRDEPTLAMLLEIDEDGENLSEWEIRFVSDLIDRGATVFTDDQKRKIRQIHADRVGR